ncbi:sodium:solute symporter family transporter [Alteromonas mediterranea]|uniref:histidine kinase n=1 Tax=Alteromonas mediterranea TaxID=314275 RepID=A0AAC9ADN9_9ALTE|nr:PAS-domain containing protein [Alteromonas mediterranea]AFV85009.1 Na+/proline symporter PutP-like domain/sensory histidine kinase and receiver domain-containing protein [Alteromonas mediterranea DE1]AGP97020.1 Na+/proline symporter PutP-like domain/sensory histidine kinase and receiver domain-containing protein [Alteromonas mediterranea UM7]AGQ01368.1 Na+/proline symporter PutP-like domain/sensory histidine kinase and receiver domain-containing protein [Alteromonas mediterranea UM4b]AMJ7813
MLSIWTVGTIVGFYLLALFALAFWGDRHLRDNRQHPVLYSLGLGVHCTSWAFFGTTSQAAQYGWAVIPTYLGITLTMAFAFPVILHISRLCQQHNISSLADLISLKYQHSHLIAALITLLCFFGVVPYIALQLDAITKSINLLTGEPQTTTPWLSIYVAGLLAIFAITFGTRTLNLTDKHPGLLLTIAFESIIKLVALWAVGIFVCFFLFDGALDLISNAASNDSARDVIYADSAPWVYLSHVALGVCSMFVLPRQFHMNFVEQNGEGELRTARWLFPLYLFGMTLFIIPIALAGKMLLPVGTSSDAYVLALPLHTENIALSSFAFIGGLSATTSMVIVATLAMGIMISNNVVTPLWLKARLKTSPNQSMQPSKILSIRRITVVVVLSIALWYHLNISQAAPLVKSGVIAIALLAQCMPVLMFGIYWRRSSKAAAVSALLVGSTCWAIFLLYPSLLSSYYFNPAPTDQALGLGFAFSLLANCITFVVVAFISSRHGTNETDTTLQSNSPPNLLVKVRDLMALTERVLESATHSQLVKQLTIDVERASSSGYASQALIDRVNKLLAAQVGAPSARILLGAIADTGRAALPELVDWVEEATQSFQFNHEVLQSSVQNIEQGISVVDDKLQLLAWNDRYVELFAYPKGFLKAGMPITDILSYNAKRGLFPPSSIDKRVSYMREGTRHKHIRKQPDGKVIELNGAPLPGGGYVTTYSDITEYMAIQKELESAKEDLEERVAQRTAELEEAKLQADKANESKTKFLAAAGHDLMQPFNAATLFASMLSKKTQGSELATLSEGVVNSLDNAQSLLSMLLDMTKLDAGVLIPQKTEFAIDEMLSSLVQEFSVIAKQKGVTLRYVQTNVMVYSDKNLLRRVLQNLLSNAVRYTPKGSILVGVRRIQTANTEKKIKLCVYDTGLGIAAHQQHEIFSEFHQLDNNKGEGIGLGLTIVEKICRLLGHQVGLTSLPGKGSCFSVTATRIMHTSGNSKQVLKTESYNKELFLENKRFLLVENDEQVANAMCALLADWGANTTLITSGTEAHNVSHQHFDVLIADYHLNYGENGFDVAAILSEENVSFALKILVTANRSNEIREKAAASQFSYLPKPLKPAALKRLLKQTLPHHH